MDFATPIVTDAVKPLMQFIKRHLGYLIFAGNNVKDMKTSIDELDARAKDIETKKATNVANRLEVPHYVPTWLKKVEEICEEGKNIPAGGMGCFNMKTRYKAGKRSSDILKEIETLKRQDADMEWSDKRRPLAWVCSTGASISEPVAADDFTPTGLNSRDLIFKEALECLDPNNKIQKIALCGMGGVGKTTMIDQLMKAVESKKMYDWVIKVDIGKKPNPINLQQAVAEYFGNKPLEETAKGTRAKSLHDRFARISENGKKNILVILDDLWEELDLKDIGLESPLLKGFKLLLTSREENVCTRMGVKASSILRMVELEEVEAKILFWEIAGIVSDDIIDHDLRKIGEDIAKGCGGLPIAIKTIASTLRENNIKDVWVDALVRLQNKELPFVKTVFKTSYENLKEKDEQATFLLIGIFPDDYHIPIEDLTRYGWGLKLFKKLTSISKARHRMTTCVHNLIRSNLLIESDRKGCVKMHDLVRDFALSNFADVKQASLVNGDDISEQLRRDSYERILLNCTGMCEFPADFNHPKLALLKLLDGGELDTFPENFYNNLEKLEVVAYEGIHQPLLPRYSTTLQTLCLSSCDLVNDISFIGDLIHLEVLSFAFCGISKLPSAIGKLRKLKLLDLTDCVDLCIDDGVFQSLGELTELYMRARKGKPIQFTEDSCEGLKRLSSKLIALEVTFFESILQPKNLSLKRLERFRISMGCEFSYYENDVYAFENTLKLVISCKELLECKINELFEKTERLQLKKVNEMRCLEDISMHPSEYSFCNLRDLVVHKCADLTSIFPVNVAISLTKLERLRVEDCSVLECLVQGENSEAKAIKFHKLKYLELKYLPRFVSLCDTDQVIGGLPSVTSIFSENNEISAMTQPLLNKKMLISNLERLRTCGMPKLKEIWSSENTSSICEEDVNSTFFMLREIHVMGCDDLVNIFPLAVISGQRQQPLSLFPNLTDIQLRSCKSVKYLFSPLMATHLSNLKNVTITDCGSMEEVVSNRDENEDVQMSAPTTTALFPHLDSLTLDRLPSLKHIGGGVAKATNNDQLKDYSQEGVVYWSLCQYSRQIDVSNCPALSNVIPSHVAGQILMVERLDIQDCILMKEVFETMQINHSGTGTSLAIPRLTSITTHRLLNLKTMRIHNCNSLEHIFTLSTLETLTKLEEISIGRCKAMKVIVRQENGEQKVASYKAVVFPRLKSITLAYLPNLEGFFLGMSEFEWPSLDDLMIIKCPKMMAFTSSKSTASKLEYIHSGFGTYSPECHNFNVKTNSPQTPSPSLKNGHLLWSHDTIKVNVEDSDFVEEIIASNELLLLPNLETIHVKRCDRVKTVFEVESEVTDGELNNELQTVVKFPKLREVDLEDLYSLWYIWKSNRWTKLEFPNLITLSIHNCRHLETVFTSSMVGSLMQLQDLHITRCPRMRVIVEEECNGDGRVSEIIMLPCLKSLTLEGIFNLQGFYLGKEVDVSLPSLNTLVIKRCPRVEVFTRGHVAAPELKVIETNVGLIDIGEHDINSFIITKKQEEGSYFGWK